MRFLIDSCVSHMVCEMLKANGYHVEWVPEVFNGDPGDEAIIDKTLSEGSILITGDKDFGEWIFLRGKAQPPLIRALLLAPPRTKGQAESGFSNQSGDRDSYFATLSHGGNKNSLE